MAGRNGRVTTAAITHMPSPLKGGGPDDALLGLVTRKPLAGGQGSSGLPCNYCGEVDGHTGQCVVVS